VTILRDACCSVVEAPISDADATRLADTLKALADPVRLRLVSLLATAPTGELCACVLPDAVGKSQPTVSHHLGLLVDAGLVDREQRGKWAWFRLRHEQLAVVRSALGEGAVRSRTRNPTVLFLCVHNAGRSQMAAGFLRHLAGDRIDVFSAGSEPADKLNPKAVAAMREVGINISRQQPQRWTTDMARTADVIVSMGCGDECPVFPGTRYVDWDLDDPAGQSIEFVRTVRDQIEAHVRSLANELLATCC
jgi:arsenate reductase (thioredoxin)